MFYFDSFLQENPLRELPSDIFVNNTKLLRLWVQVVGDYHITDILMSVSRNLNTFQNSNTCNYKKASFRRICNDGDFIMW